MKNKINYKNKIKFHDRLQEVHTSSSKLRSSRESSDEKNHSLLDMDEEEEITTTTVKSVIQNNNKTVTNSGSKTKSRKPQLPDDYNKLEIPKKPSFNSVIKFTPEFDQYSSEQKVMSEKHYMEVDLAALGVSIEAKVQNVRDIDEIDEVPTIVKFSITQELWNINMSGEIDTFIF